MINIFLEGNRMNFSLDIIERTERTNWTLSHRDTLSYELLKVEKSSLLEKIITENTLLISAQFWSKNIEVTVTKLLKNFQFHFRLFPLSLFLSGF